MGVPVGYRKITSNDVGKTFGVNLETVIKFDDATSVGYWYINAEPPFGGIEWMLFSDGSNFYSQRGGNPSFWMIDTFFRGSQQSMSEGSYPNPDDYIIFTSETVPSGVTITDLWPLDTTWMNYVYVKDKEPNPEYTIAFSGNGGTSPSSQTTTNQKLTSLPSSTRIGYQFSGWYTAASGGTKITTSTVFSTNRAVYAQWILEDYNIKFYDYDNSVVASFIEKYFGEGITLPTPPTRPGYTFDGWYNNRIQTTYHLYNGSGNKITWTIVPDLGESGREYNFYAKYTPKQYTLYYSHGFEYSSTVTYNEPYNRSELNSEPYSKEGYTWVGWYDASSGGNKITSTSLVKIVTTNNYIYAYARWTQDPVYTITFSDTKGNSTTRDISSPQNYKVNPLPNASANGFDFQGWYTATSGGTKITTSTVFSANTTVYAQWKPIYTITFNGNGGTSPNSQSVHFDGGYKLTNLPSSTRTNYVFQGWYTATSGGTKITTSRVFSANTTVYAQWKGKAYTVQFYSNGGGVPSPSSKTVYYGEVYGQLATVSRSAYNFVGWFSVSSSSGGTQVTPSTVVTTTSPKQLYARWSLTTYTVTYNTNGGTSVSKTIGLTALPTSLPVTTKTGYDFVGWFYDPLLKNQAFGGDALTQNITLYAGWTQKTYKVVFKNWDGSVLKTQTVSHGGNATAPANPTRDSTPQYNYTFNGWDKAFTNVTQNLDITATYTETLQSYTITWVANGGKFSNNNTVLTTNHNYGTTPKPNLTLSRDSTVQYHYNTYAWTPPITTVTGEKIYTADWDSYKELRSYDVIFRDWNQTIIKTQSVSYGSSATPPPDPTRPQNDEFTYTFSGWVGTYTNITGPVTIYADYTATTRSYNITWLHNDGTGKSTITQEYYNDNPTPPSLERTGYNLTGWSPTIVAVVGAKTYSAIWTKKTYTVKFFDYDPVNEIPGVQPIKTESVLYQENATPPTSPTFPGFDFDEWTQSYEEVSSDLIIYAKYKPKLFTLTIETNIALQSTTVSRTSSPYQNAGTTIIDNKIYYGDVLSISAVAKTGYNNPTVTSPVTVQGNIRTIQDGYVIVGSIKTNPVKFFVDGIQIGSTQNVPYGSDAIAPANPTKSSTSKYTYTFNSWSEVFTNVTAPVNVHAIFTSTINKYNITWKHNDGTTNSTVTQVYYDSEPTPPILTRAGYTFSHWTPDIFIVIGDATYTAQWTPINYSIIYNLDGGTNNPNNPSTYNIETPSITFANPSKTGYIFNDWSITGIPKGSTGNKTTDASWTEIQYTITFNSNGGTTANPTSRIVKYTGGYKLDGLSTTTRSGYTFKGWYTATSGGTQITTNTVFSGNTTIYAQWILIEYIITFNGNGGSSGTTRTVSINTGYKLTSLSTTTRSGYDLKGWYSATSGGTEITTNTIFSGNTTVYAQWLFINVPNLNSIANDCAFNNNDQYLVVAHETTPYVTIYKKGTNDTFSKMNLTAPSGKAESCAFSPDGRYLAIGHQNAPGLTIYKKGTGDNFTKLTMSSIEQNIALSCTFSKDNKYLAVTHLNAPYVTIYETGEIDIFTKMNALSSPDGDQVLGSSSSFSYENEYLAITYSNSPYVAVIKAQRNENEKHTYLLDNSFSTVSELLDTPLIELGYASQSGSSSENKKVKLIWRY